MLRKTSTSSSIRRTDPAMQGACGGVLVRHPEHGETSERQYRN
jgi:hypothetical protein